VSDIAVDTSAVIEVFLEGPQAEAVRRTLQAADLVFVASTARVEAAFVMIGRFGWDRVTFDRNWDTLGLEEVPVDSVFASATIDAFAAWGRGQGTAGLNFGDCFSYALAAARGLPLLFVGEDFTKTSIDRA
jgi:ribonuclease VapC